MGHYDVLGIARTASNLEIRSAYRKGALQTHPDPQLKFFLGNQARHSAHGSMACSSYAKCFGQDKGGDPEEFKKVVGAFEVLSDPKKRGDLDLV